MVLRMRRLLTITLAVLCTAGPFSGLRALAQKPATQRKIISKVMPVYPELARHIGLEGAVRLEVVVAPNGVAKSMQAVGGSPLLIRAAQDAIQKWKWEPAPLESQVLVELTFHP
jgi:TonB family protein